MEEDDVLKGLEEDPRPKKTPEENTTFKPADLTYFQNGDDTQRGIRRDQRLEPRITRINTDGKRNSPPFIHEIRG
jgi:hypothetical protein